MGADSFDPNDPRVLLIVTKQQLKFKDELNDLQRQLDLKKQELLFIQEAIKRNTNKTSKKRGKAKFLAFLASLIFLFSTLLTSFGISMLTSTPPVSEGWFMITLGIASYIIGAIMTNLLALGEND